MIRVLNFFCFAITALTCLALYHVSEQTRVARSELAAVNRGIVAERATMSVLEAEWGRVADPERVHALAQVSFGAGDEPVVELASLDLLPRHGEEAPLSPTPLRNANAQAPQEQPQEESEPDPSLQLAAAKPED